MGLEDSANMSDSEDGKREKPQIPHKTEVKSPSGAKAKADDVIQNQPFDMAVDVNDSEEIDSEEEDDDERND